MVGIGLPNPRVDRGLRPDEPRVMFEDDAAFRFLAPLVDALERETGERIDPYGDAEFAGPALDALERFAAAAHAMVVAKTEIFGVDTGAGLVGDVERATLLRQIGALQDVMRRARQTGSAVNCIGD
jgi:hypothetical protein